MLRKRHKRHLHPVDLPDPDIFHILLIPVGAHHGNVILRPHVVPVVHGGDQPVYALIQHMVVAHGDHVEASVQNRLSQLRGRIEIEVGAGNGELIVGNERLLVDDGHIPCLDVGLHVFVARAEVIGTVRGIGLGSPQHPGLHQVVPYCHHSNLPILRLCGRLLPAFFSTALGRI